MLIHARHLLAVTLVSATSLGATTAIPATSSAAEAGPVATTVNSCHSDDNGQPVVDSVTVSPGTVDASDGPVTVDVTVQAHDTGGPGPATGVKEVSVLLAASAGPGDVGRSPLLGLSPSGDGSWHASVVIPRGTHTTYDAYSDAFDGLLGSSEDVQHGSLTVTGTADGSDPVLADFQVDRSHVDTRRHAVRVHASARLTDTGSGVRSARLRVYDQVAKKPASVSLHRVGDTDRWRTAFTVPRWNGQRAEELTLVFADRVGHTVVMHSDQLRSAGFPARVTVTSGPRDTSPPRVVGEHAAPRVDVRRHGRWYRVSLVAADNRGVTGVQVTLLGRQAWLHRVGGTPQRGTWTGRLRIGRCFGGPATYGLQATLTDGFNMRHRRAIARVRVISHDTIEPGFDLADLTADDHVVTYAFNEAVHGISADEVEMTTEDNQVIPGSWACQKGSGTVTSCLTGSVRRATFTPDDASATGPLPFAVDFSPEHHLAVLDRHGNPLFQIRPKPIQAGD